MMSQQQRIAPATACVRPMVQTITSGGLATTMALPQAVTSSAAPCLEALREAAKPPSSNTVKVKIPAGRYKYSTATCNGRPGVYLIPILDSTPANKTSNLSSLFVPFSANGAPAPAVVHVGPQQPSITPSLPSSTPVLSSVPSEAKLNQHLPVTVNLKRATSGKLPTSKPSFVVSSTPPGIQLGSSTKTVYPQYPSKAAKANLIIRPAVDTSRPALATVARSGAGLSTGQVRGHQPTMNFTRQQPVPIQPRNVTPGKFPSSLPRQRAMAHQPTMNFTRQQPVPIQPRNVTPGKCPSSLTRQRAMAGKLFASAMKSSNSLFCEDEDVNSLEKRLQNICPVKTENVEEEIAAEDLPFKIDSVFSLCSGQEKSFADLPQVDHTDNNNNNNICKYHDTRFVVLENLDMKYRSSISVRSLRKFTGRRGCSDTCRENAVRKLCQWNKLSVCEKTHLDVKVENELENEVVDITSVETVSTWETLEDPNLLTEFKRKARRFKPAPKSVKFKKFKQAKLDEIRKRKSKSIPNSQSTESKTIMSTSHLGKRKSLPGSVKQEDVKYPKIPANLGTPDADSLPKAPAGRLVNSASIESSNGSIASLGSTHQLHDLIPSSSLPIDTNSAAFQQIVAAMGTKKFYLIKIEGKNILLPMEQNTEKPRAYMLGGDKPKTTASPTILKEEKRVSVSETTNQLTSSLPVNTTCSPSATVPASCPTSALSHQNTRIKTEPRDTGYEQQLPTDHTGTTVIRVKEEATDRGYPDELPPTSRSAFKPCGPIPSTTGYPGHVHAAQVVSESRPETTSEERISRLKAMLQEREKQLEEIRAERKNKPVVFTDDR